MQNVTLICYDGNNKRYKPTSKKLDRKREKQTGEEQGKMVKNKYTHSVL